MIEHNQKVVAKFVPEYRDEMRRLQTDGSLCKPGWYIMNLCNGKTIMAKEPGNDTGVFARRQDVLVAIHALAERGIVTHEQVLALSYDEFREICYGALAW